MSPIREAMIDALTWRDAARASALLDPLPRDTLADLAFHAACVTQVAALGAIRPPPPNDLAWLGSECDDPAIEALCTLPPGPDSTPAHVAACDRAWDLVAPLPFDPLVGYVRLTCCRTWLASEQHSDRIEASTADAWARRSERPGQAALAASLRIFHLVRIGRAEEAWALGEDAVPLAGGHTGGVVDALLLMASHAAERTGRYDRAEALASRGHSPHARATALGMRLLRGEIAPVVAALEAERDALGDAAPESVHLWLALALFDANRPDDAVSAAAPLRSSSRPTTRRWVSLVDAASGRPVDPERLAADVAGSLPVPHIRSLLRRALADGGPGARGRDPGSRAAARVRRIAALAEAEVDPAAADRLAAGGPADGPVPVGPFDLMDPIGTGGNAVVYAARHHATGATAAVKVLTRAGVSADLLRAEARLLAALRHPNIVQILGSGVVDRVASVQSGGRLEAGAAWLAMERVAGGTLEGERVDEGALRALLSDLLDALAHAHARGVLHLDLKPSNVLVARRGAQSTPQLTDFGVEALSRTVSGRIAGTPAYMPPEQWRGRREHWGPPTDLYALGLLAWELLAGERPFAALTWEEARARHQSPDRPGFEGASPAMRAWLGRATALHPGDRFQTAAEAAAALRGTPGPQRTTVGPYGPNSPLLPPHLALERFDLGPLSGLEHAQAALRDAIRAAHTGTGAVRVSIEGPGSGALGAWVAHEARVAGVPPEGLVVGVASEHATHRVAAAPLSEHAIVRILMDRLPLVPELADDLASRASGDPDLALDLLAQLVRADALVRDGRLWALDPDTRLEAAEVELVSLQRALHDPADARALAVAVLSGRPLAERVDPVLLDRLRELGLVAGDALVRPARDWLVERYRADVRVLEEALDRSRDPVARARVLALRGDTEGALALLLDTAHDAIFGFGDPHSALREAAALRQVLPPRYHFLRGLALRLRGELEASRPFLRRGAHDPALRASALANLADTEHGPARIELLEQAVAASGDPRQRSGLLTDLGLELATGPAPAEVAIRTLRRAVHEVPPPANGYARLICLWLACPASTSPAWSAAIEEVRDTPGVSAIVHQRAGWCRSAAHLLWGDADPPGSDLDPRMQHSLHALRAVRSDDPPGLAARLAAPDAAVVSLDAWAWALQWWLEADAPDARWDSVVQRWPANRWSPVGVWLLSRIADRCTSVARRLEIEQVLARARERQEALSELWRPAPRALGTP
ncbi:MAG: protein kinase [Myxococcota bacterium]